MQYALRIIEFRLNFAAPLSPGIQQPSRFGWAMGWMCEQNWNRKQYKWKKKNRQGREAIGRNQMDTTMSHFLFYFFFSCHINVAFNQRKCKFWILSHVGIIALFMAMRHYKISIFFFVRFLVCSDRHVTLRLPMTIQCLASDSICASVVVFRFLFAEYQWDFIGSRIAKTWKHFIFSVSCILCFVNLLPLLCGWIERNW